MWLLQKSTDSQIQEVDQLLKVYLLPQRRQGGVLASSADLCNCSLKHWGETLTAAVAEQWDQGPSETRWPEAKESVAAITKNLLGEVVTKLQNLCNFPFYFPKFLSWKGWNHIRSRLG